MAGTITGVAYCNGDSPARPARIAEEPALGGPFYLPVGRRREGNCLPFHHVLKGGIRTPAQAPSPGNGRPRSSACGGKKAYRVLSSSLRIFPEPVLQGPRRMRHSRVC